MAKCKQAIYDLLQESKDHLTAEEIFFNLKKKIPSLAIGTVYRNLNILIDEKRIRKLTYANDADHYDNVKMAHDHVRCIRCGKIFDIPKICLNIGDFQGVVLDYDVNIKAICQECEGYNG